MIGLLAVSRQPLARRKQMQDFRELKVWQKIAFASCAEAEYHLLLAKDLRYLNDEHYATLVERATEIRKMLSHLILKLKADG